MDVLVEDRNLWELVAKWRDFLQGEDSWIEKNWRRVRKKGRPLVDHRDQGSNLNNSLKDREGQSFYAGYRWGNLEDAGVGAGGWDLVVHNADNSHSGNSCQGVAISLRFLRAAFRMSFLSP